MAGIEELEVHSKSYLVRWVYVKGGHTISWSIRAHRKSLNFGIFKHPGHSAVLNSSESYIANSNETVHLPIDAGSRPNASATLIEKLTTIGLKPIQWIGKCEADKVCQGAHDVPANESGNYALVFDNTFSKQTSKMATVVLLTYPTAMPPQSHSHQNARYASFAPSSNQTPSIQFHEGESIESTESLRPTIRARGKSASGSSIVLPQSSDSSTPFPSMVHSGILQKRRRKRHQGWARRFFSLDFTSSTLSYYRARNSTALRGAIPLFLAVVATNEKTREISIDSGAEIWHLRANNAADFSSWRSALETASSQALESSQSELQTQAAGVQPHFAINTAEEHEWSRVEALVGKVSGMRDDVRRLAKDTDPKYFSPTLMPHDRLPNQLPSPLVSPMEANGEDTSETRERRPFWRRKSSVNSQSSGKRSINSPQLTVPSPVSEIASPVRSLIRRRSTVGQGDHMEDVHDHLMALLRDLDSVMVEFSALIAESKQRRHPPQTRLSMESDMSQEFFDATDGGNLSPFLTIREDSEDEADGQDREEGEPEEEEDIADDATSTGSDEMEISTSLNDFQRDASASFFPTKPKSLVPLPLERVERRTQIRAPTVMPPSLIGFLRKNVGKDLSQVSMPVSANEPLSLLQRAAEVLEYSTLLDKAASVTDTIERLLYVTAFALSSLSSGRVKERAIRKPFNPMLGETYELVREDRGFRFVAEKVSHRPVQLAYQAESKDWSLTQSPKPTQKFWGKSAEIVTEGKVRLTLHATGEHFIWSVATSFLRNIIAGEKYVEPVGEMSVVNETTGQKSVSAFKSGGMFSGRSEEVTTRTFDSYGRELPFGLSGTWTSGLSLTKTGSGDKPIWSAGPLVHHAPKHYGLTEFAATLNEITPIEDQKLPSTDSRMRPDQRALEDGDLDRAEELKGRLEECQRARRREMESAGTAWTPRWFARVQQADGGSDIAETVWRLKTGKDGYWEERSRGAWAGVVPIFEL